MTFGLFADFHHPQNLPVLRVRFSNCCSVICPLEGETVKKGNAILAAAALLVLGTSMPAHADSKGGGGGDVSSMAKTAAWFPVQVLGVTSAWVLGTPIAMTRRSAIRIHDFTSEGADKIGGHDHFPPVLFASIFGVPAGTLVGSAEGVYYGGKNAVSHGVEHPFSLDSFSLGDDMEQ